MSIERLPYKWHIDPETDASYLYISNINDASHWPHCHEFFGVMLVVSGKATHIINNKRVVMSDGDLIFIRPDDVHYFEVIHGFQCQFINVPFSPSTFQALCNYLDEGFPKLALMEAEFPPSVELSAIEKNILRQKFEALNLLPISEKKLVKLELRALLVYLFTNYIVEALPSATQNIPPWFQELCLSMNNKENFIQGIASMTKITGKSHEHLCRLFKKHYNTTPINYLNDLKLNYCANLLANSDFSI